MNRIFETSKAIIKEEFRLQLIAALWTAALFVLTMIAIRFTNNLAELLPAVMVTGFYIFAFGFVLPWQTNNHGHLTPGYCRYNLNLPLHTWQLTVLPFILRLSLLLGFIGLTTIAFAALYKFPNVHYNWNTVIDYTEKSTLLYIGLQAFAWSRESFKNVFLWLGVACLACAVAFQGIFKLFTVHSITYYWLAVALLLALTVALLLALAFFGVRNLQRGVIFSLPGLDMLARLLPKPKGYNQQSFETPEHALFVQTWKRTWYIMPSCLVFFLVLVSILIFKPEYYHYNFLNLTAIFLGMCLTLPLIGIISIQRVERNRYFYNMPAPSYIISRARLKAFCLSFAVSLGIGVFGLFTIYKLFLAPNLPNVLLNSQPNYFNQPVVVIWFVAAAIVWAYAIAFTIITAYYQRYLLFTFFVIAAGFIMLRSGLMSSLHGPGGLFRDLKSVPFWNIMLFAIMFLALAKYSSALTAKGGYVKKTARIISLFIAAALICFACLFLRFMLLIPAVIIISYPAYALCRNISNKRHEQAIDAPLPCRTILIVTVLFSLFASFSYLTESILKNRLTQQVKACKEITASCPWRYPEQNIMRYALKNAPFPKMLLLQIEKFKKSNPKSNTYAMIKSVLSKLCYKSNNSSSLKQLEFYLQISAKYASISSSRLRRLIFGLPALDQADFKQLEQIKLSLRELFRNILVQRINTQVRVTNEMIKSFKAGFGFISEAAFSNNQTLLINRKAQQPPENISLVPVPYSSAGYLDFRKRYIIKRRTQSFESKFLMIPILCSSLDYIDTRKRYIDSLLFILHQKDESKKSLPEGKDFFVDGSFPVSCNAILESIVSIANRQYKIKNRTAPDNINQLVPRYLNLSETYLLGFKSHEDNIYMFFHKNTLENIALIEKSFRGSSLPSCK
ncbi:hypothetical protein P0136_01455 [Lentisphaerota bacterium ZTH]|nr:hypothetical protein JYG24_07405 [Lentisphaerota bacterium]WET06680.1 hypothetical protein P0136_01455 [Lentisphaerota bacterium ZTH]